MVEDLEVISLRLQGHPIKYKNFLTRHCGRKCVVRIILETRCPRLIKPDRVEDNAEHDQDPRIDKR